MTLKTWFIGIFSNNKSAEGLEAVREVGKCDGRELAAAYGDGFLEGVNEVLNDRLKSFHGTIETTAAVMEDSPKLTAKSRPSRRKLSTK